MNKWTPPRKPGRIPHVRTRFSMSMETNRLTRDGTADPSDETKLPGANADREILIFPVQLTTSRIGNLTPVDLYPCYMCDHTYIHT